MKSKRGGREGQHRACRLLLCVTAGQGVGDRVRRARLVLDREIKPEELAHPMVLWDRREPLVK